LSKEKASEGGLTVSDLGAENWQRPLEDAMAWFRTQSATAQDGLKKDLILSILEATCKEGKEKWNREESEEFAQFMLDEIQNKQGKGNERQKNDGMIFARDATNGTYLVSAITAGSIRRVQQGELTSMFAIIRSNTAHASIKDASERRIQSNNLWLFL
jgi:hypothetical protein